MADQESKTHRRPSSIQLAEQLPAWAGAPAALRMIAGALRGDDAMAERWLTQFLHHVEIGELLGAAALKLEAGGGRWQSGRTAGTEHVAAAARSTMAGLIIVASSERRSRHAQRCAGGAEESA